jgi:hypothetical protein
LEGVKLKLKSSYFSYTIGGGSGNIFLVLYIILQSYIQCYNKVCAFKAQS